VEGENDSPSSAETSYITPDWNDVVDKLVQEYPKTFNTDDYTGPALQFQKISEEHARRQREKRAIAAQKKDKIETGDQ
jgi:hypothetical protein